MNKLNKYIKQNNLLEGIEKEHHEEYKKDISKSTEFALFELKEAANEFFKILRIPQIVEWLDKLISKYLK